MAHVIVLRECPIDTSNPTRLSDISQLLLKKFVAKVLTLGEFKVVTASSSDLTAQLLASKLSQEKQFETNRAGRDLRQLLQYYGRQQIILVVNDSLLEPSRPVKELPLGLQAYNSTSLQISMPMMEELASAFKSRAIEGGLSKMQEVFAEFSNLKPLAEDYEVSKLLPQESLSGFNSHASVIEELQRQMEELESLVEGSQFR